MLPVWPWSPRNAALVRVGFLQQPQRGRGRHIFVVEEPLKYRYELFGFRYSRACNYFRVVEVSQRSFYIYDYRYLYL